MNEVVIFYAHHRLMRLYVSLLCSLLFLISLSTKCVNSTNFIGFKHWITISYHEHCSQIYTLNIYYCSHHVRHKQWLCSVAQSYPTLWHPIAHQAHQSMGFSRQEYWNGLPFPLPGSNGYLSFDYFLSNSTKSSHKTRFLKQWWKETLETRTPDLQTCQNNVNLKIWVSTEGQSHSYNWRSCFPRATKTDHWKRKDTHRPMDGPCFWMRKYTDWLKSHFYWLAKWLKSNQGNMPCILVDRATQTQLTPDCVTSTWDGSQRFHLRPKWSDLGAVSFAFSFSRTKGSKDPRKQEDRNWSCPDSITLNYLMMNKYSLFHGFNGRWTTTKNIRCSSCFQSLSIRIIHDFWPKGIPSV